MGKLQLVGIGCTEKGREGTLNREANCGAKGDGKEDGCSRVGEDRRWQRE